jgi:hypothetical protein
VVLKQKAQAAAAKILMVFMTRRETGERKRGLLPPTSVAARAIRQKAPNALPKIQLFFKLNNKAINLLTKYQDIVSTKKARLLQG